MACKCGHRQSSLRGIDELVIPATIHVVRLLLTTKERLIVKLQ